MNDLTANTTVREGTRRSSPGQNVVVTATGDDTDESEADTASYKTGKYGITVAVNDTTANVTTTVDGTVIANGASSQNESSLASATFNPFTDVNPWNAPNNPNTIEFGTTNPGFSGGESVVYNSGNDGPIDGLVNGQTYYVINPTTSAPYTIQLADTSGGNCRAHSIPSRRSRPRETAATGTEFTDVNDSTFNFIVGSDVQNNQINLGEDDGLTTGEPVIYSTDGDTVGGLTTGTTYYVVVVNPTTIELANSYADAVAANPIILPLDPTMASGTQNIGPTGTEFSFQPARGSMTATTRSTWERPAASTPAIRSFIPRRARRFPA